MAEKIPSWWDIENYVSTINVVSQSKKELQAQNLIVNMKKFTGGW